MSNEVVVQAPTGTAVAKVGGTGRLGLENVNLAKLRPPRVALAQDLSKVVKQLKIAQAGDWVNTVTNEVYGRELQLIIIRHQPSAIKWREMKQGGGAECMSFDGITGSAYGSCKAQFDQSGKQIKPACQFCGNWSKDPVSGRPLPPACTDYDNFMVLVRGQRTPKVISFGKSSAKCGQQIINCLWDMDPSLPPWSKVFKVWSQDKSFGGNVCAVPFATVVGDTTEEERALAAQLFTMYSGHEVADVAAESEAELKEEDTATAPVSGAPAPRKGGRQI